MSIIDYIIIAVYMVGMLAVGWYASGKIKTMDDFVLGGKRFGKFALIGTILATMVGSGMTMGAVGSVYTSGITGSMIYIYVGFAIGLIVFGFMSHKIRATGARSLSELISMSFGKEARLTSAIVVVIYAASLVAINIAGLRTIIIYVFGEHVELSIPMATAIAACISIAYTAMGGFYAVVWTDVVQLGIMIVGVFILGPILGVSMAGGLDVISAGYVDAGLSMSDPFMFGISPGLMGMALAYLLAVPGDPTMPQRTLSAKNDNVAKFSFITSGVIALCFGISILLIGGSIFILMPGLEASDAALPAFVMAYYPPVLKGITIAGIIAAIMSSFDSFLILSTTHIMYDIGSVINPSLDEEKTKKAMPIVTICMGAVGIIIALFIQGLLGYLSMVFSIVGSALVPALVAALYFNHSASKTGVVGSIITGTIVPAYLFLTKGYDVFLGDPVFIGLIASVAVLVIGSLIFKNKDNKSITETETAEA